MAQVNLPKVQLFEHINFGGERKDVNGNIAGIGFPMVDRCSSIRIFHKGWVAFWESPDYDRGDDSLWVQPLDGANDFEGIEIPSLVQVWRPHGTNNFNDIISGVSFEQGPPQNTDLENIVIIRTDFSSMEGFPVARIIDIGDCGINRSSLEATKLNF